MKKKIFIPIGIATSLSLVSASALSGCNNSTVAVSIRNVVDFNLDAIDSFYTRVANSLNNDTKKDEKKPAGDASDKKPSSDTAAPDNSDKKPSSQTVASNSSDASQRPSFGANVLPTEPSGSGVTSYTASAPSDYTVVSVVNEGTTGSPERISYAASSAVQAKPVAKPANNTKPPVSNEGVSDRDTTKKNENKEEVIKPEPVNTVPDEEPVIPPVSDPEPEPEPIIEPEPEPDPDYGEIPPDDHEHEWVPGWEDIEDPVDYEPVLTAKTVYKEVIDNSKITSYSDCDGNVICYLTKIGTVETYEDGELVSTEGEDKAGTLEIHNVATDEIFTFAPGELAEPDEYIRGMFEFEVFMDGRMPGPSYSGFIEVLDNNFYAYYSDSLANRICEVRIYDTVDRYENDVLVSSVSEKEVGTTEIHNLVTGEVHVFAPGELEDYEEFVMDIFDGKAYFSGALIGPAYAEPVDFEGDEDFDYSDPYHGYDEDESDFNYWFDDENDIDTGDLDDGEFYIDDEYEDDPDNYVEDYSEVYVCEICGEVMYL